jgi:hypothetical protein
LALFVRSGLLFGFLGLAGMILLTGFRWCYEE